MINELTNFLMSNESLLEMDDEDIIDETLETEIFLTALREECENDEEFDEIVTECATELELYGLIHKAEIVTEARKNVVRLNKEASFNRIEKRTAIRMAEKANDALYKSYKRGRDLMIASRLKIYDKYGAKAKNVARKVVRDSKRKSSAMKTDTGKTISEKMDKVIEKNDTK